MATTDPPAIFLRSNEHVIESGKAQNCATHDNPYGSGNKGETRQKATAVEQGKCPPGWPKGGNH